MTEEIIIDGVNVAECEFIADTKNGLVKCISWVHNNKKQVSGHWDCRENKNCYYKQLKRLEFELKVTKADYEASKQENKKLKEKIQILNKNSYASLRELSVLDAELDEVGFMNNTYRSALEEISGLASPHCTQCSQIIKIINEVLQ